MMYARGLPGIMSVFRLFPALSVSGSSRPGWRTWCSACRQPGKETAYLRYLRG